MRRGAVDTLRRGFDNAVANWPLAAIRVAETLLFGVIAFATAVALLLPILVSVGITAGSLGNPETLAAFVLSLAGKWVILFWIFAAVSVLLLLFLVVHSFVEAGRARVLVLADENAGPAIEGPRQRYERFSAQLWLSGAKDGWWAVFWIYNGAWAIACLLMMIPLVPTLVLVLLLRNQPSVAIGIGCLGLLLTVGVTLVVGFVTNLWTSRAITEWAAAPRTPAADLLADSWKKLRADFGRHLLVGLATVVVSIAGSTFFGSVSLLFGLGAAMGDSALSAILSMPFRIAGSILSSIFTAAVSTWALASFAAMAVEEKAD